MYVFLANMPGVDMQLLPFGNVLEHSLQLLFDICVSEYPSAVLGTPDDVIVTNPRCVGLLVEASVHG